MARGALRWGTSGRGTRLFLPMLSALVTASVATPSASASPLVPPGFRLAASNGYKTSGIFFDGTPHEERDELILFVARRHSSVVYFAPAVADESSVSAQLGSVGSVDLHFVPSGHPRREPTPCGTPKRIAVESGFFEGTVDLRGEEGYMRAHATHVSADARTTLSLICGGSGSEGSGGHSPGARLTISRTQGPTMTQFVARKNSPTRISRFEASVRERVGKLEIARVISSTAAPAAFQFDTTAKSAILDPGGLFAGEATYDGTRGPFGRVHGDLAADFPGHSGVRLTGSGTRATMIRYVDNPSHPFRLASKGGESHTRVAPFPSLWMGKAP